MVTAVVETVEDVKEDIPQEKEQVEEEDTQITAEMGGTMILKRQAAAAAEVRLEPIHSYCVGLGWHIRKDRVCERRG